MRAKLLPAQSHLLLSALAGHDAALGRALACNTNCSVQASIYHHPSSHHLLVCMANEMQTTAKEPLHGSNTMNSLKKAFVSANNDVPFTIKLEESSDDDQVENSANGNQFVKSHHPGMFLQTSPNDDGARCIQVSSSSSLEVGNIVSPRLDPLSVQTVFRKNTFHDTMTMTTTTNPDSFRPFLSCNSCSSSMTSISENFPWGHIPLGDIQTDWATNMEEYYGYFVGLDDDEFSIEPIPLHALAAGAPVEPDDGEYYIETGNTNTNAGLALGTAVSSSAGSSEHENWPNGKVPAANNARLSSNTCLHVLAVGASTETDDGDYVASAYLRALAAGVPVEPDGCDGVENGSGASMGLDWGAAVLPTPTERETWNNSNSIPVGCNVHHSAYRPPLPSTHHVARALPEKAPRQAKKKATAALVSSTRRVPSTRKRKVQSSCNEENDSKKSKTDAVVGPDSTEMIAIKRMLIYLEQTSSDVALVRSFHNIVKESEKRHTKGQAKYKHLPGAIFERLIEQVGGEVFMPIYKASRTFEHEHINAIYQQESASGSLDYEDLTASGIEMPNLLQVAVGYGFHLARMSMLNHGHDTCEDIEELMESGAETALNMKDDERFLFWKYMVESQSVKEHLAGNF